MERKRKSRHYTQERQGVRLESSKVYSRHPVSLGTEVHNAAVLQASHRGWPDSTVYILASFNTCDVHRADYH
jgi:hypothetical protein